MSKVTPEDIQRLEVKLYNLLVDILEGDKKTHVKASVLTCIVQYLKMKGYGSSKKESFTALNMDTSERNFEALELPYQ